MRGSPFHHLRASAGGGFCDRARFPGRPGRARGGAEAGRGPGRPALTAAAEGRPRPLPPGRDPRPRAAPSSPPGRGQEGSGATCGCQPSASLAAAGMDAAPGGTARRGRPERPPPARDSEEEEEEDGEEAGMEPGWRTEEVDPGSGRRARGARGAGLRAQPTSELRVPARRERPGRPGLRGRAPSAGFRPVPQECGVPADGPTPSPGLPLGPGRLPTAACPALEADDTVKERGRGRLAGFGGTRSGSAPGLCATSGLPEPGRRHSARQGEWAPATTTNWGGRPARGRALTPGRGPSGATPRPRADSLLANRRVWPSHPGAALRLASNSLKPSFPPWQSSVNEKAGPTGTKLTREKAKGTACFLLPPYSGR